MATKSAIQGNGGRVRRVVVVGGGVAGLMTVLELCEANVAVDLLSLYPVRRSPSVCDQGGISAALDTKGEGDSPQIHLEETLYGGDFLANQPPVKGMTEAAPAIVDLLDRLGVPFDRTPEGLRELRRSAGSDYQRTVFAGARTGQQVLYALDDQVRRFEGLDAVDGRGVSVVGEKRVRKFEGWDFVEPILDDAGVCVGCVAQDLTTMQFRSFVGDAVVLATGGLGRVFGPSTNRGTGSAASAAYQAGAVYANGELMQVYPTSFLGSGTRHVLSERLRTEGGRLWAAKDPSDKRSPLEIPERERDYLLERLYPSYGPLVPSDLASRALFTACLRQGRGLLDAATGAAVYLDLTHGDDKALRAKLAGELELCAKLTGTDPYTTPIRVCPAVHTSLGGLWVDYERDARGSVKAASPRNHATSLPGLYAVGEVDYQYHGANCLESNALLSCLYGGMLTGPAVVSYRQGLAKSAVDRPTSVFDKAQQKASSDYQRILAQNAGEAGAENAYLLHDELAESMLRDCTLGRDDKALDGLLAKLSELDERVTKVRVTDTAQRVNQGAPFVRHLENMLVLARVIAEGARRRGESRGAHDKPEHPARSDADWGRTTLAVHEQKGAVKLVRGFDYVCAGERVSVTDAIDTSLVAPRARTYAEIGAASAPETRIPTEAR